MATAKKSKAALKKNNTTGYVGVVKVGKKYAGQSYFDGKTHRTEAFAKPVEAAKAYDELVSDALAKGLLKRVTLNFPTK